ncbi:putative VV A18-like helicase [Namao virus]|nr:putative VV A18-like helicase [Namao virus]
MDTKITLCGYRVKKISFTLEELSLLIKDLTVEYKNSFSEKSSTVLKTYYDYHKYLFIPRHYGLLKFGLPLREQSDFQFRRHPKISDHHKFMGTLSKKQSHIVHTILKYFCDEKAQTLKNHAGGVICVVPGGGKTVIAIKLIFKVKVKCLVVLHKNFLIHQWRNRFQQFAPTLKVGTIQQDVLDVEDKDVVLAMIQSLYKRKYDLSYFADFGMIIFDECHHLGAQMFYTVLQMYGFPYMIGLSATPKRSDGMEKIIYRALGPILYSDESSQPVQHVVVQPVLFFSEDPFFKSVYYRHNGKINFPTTITNIAKIKDRNDFICTYLIISLIQTMSVHNIVFFSHNPRKVLILSGRRQQVSLFHDQLSLIFPDAEIGIYLGGTRQKDLEEAEKKPIILGTYDMAQEALDIPELDTLILTTCLKGSIKQTVGRILRGKSKNIPLILDIVDNLDFFWYKWSARKKYYREQQFYLNSMLHFKENKWVSLN